MQRSTIEIVLEHPAGSPLAYINTTGGNIVKVIKEEVTKVEDLGKIEMPWDQKVREFNAVKKLIIEAVASVSKDWKVYGSSNPVMGPHDPGRWQFWFQRCIDTNCLGWGGLTSADFHRDYLTFHNGTLTWTEGYTHSAYVKIKIGDPNIIAEIAEAFRGRLRLLKVS